MVQSAVHAKISTLYGRSYGRTSKFFRLDGLLKFFIIMGLRCYATGPKNNRVHTLEQQRNRSSAYFQRRTIEHEHLLSQDRTVGHHHYYYIHDLKLHDIIANALMTCT